MFSDGVCVKKLLSCLFTVLIATPIMAAHHALAKEEVYAAIEGFDDACATNEVETYFAYYSEGADLFFLGQRQGISAYHEEWSVMVEPGGRVEKNDIPDVNIRVLPGGESAIATYFVDYASVLPDGDRVVAKAFELEVWQIVSLHYLEIKLEQYPVATFS